MLLDLHEPTKGIALATMNILYITKLDLPSGLGVSRKVQRQVELWSEAGLCVAHVNFTKSGKNSVINWDTKDVTQVKYRNHFQLFLNLIKILHLFKSTKKLDIVYMRWIPILPNIVKFFSKDWKLIVEFNGIHFLENRNLFILRKMFYWLSHKLTWMQIDGSTVSSIDILQHPNFPIKNKSVFVPNPIFKSDTVKRGSDKLQEKRLLFIGTPNRFWHGLEEINFLATALPDWEIDIVGYDKFPNSPLNVTYHGLMDINEVESLAQGATAGIGPLGLERVGLTTGSPLKVLDYISWGLPLVLAHKDYWAEELDFPRIVLTQEFTRDALMVNTLKSTLELWNKEPPVTSPHSMQWHKENLRIDYFKSFTDSSK